MKPCISQASTLTSSFTDDIAGYAAGGCTAAELWLTKLEKHLNEASIDDTRQLFADGGVSPVAAAYQGGLLLSQGEQRKAHFDHFRRRLELCEVLGIPTVLLVADFAHATDPQALGRAVVSLKQAAQWAAGFGVRLGLEFRGTDTFCNCLDTAISLVEQCGEPNVGVCLDVFHYYKGPSKPEDLDRLTVANLAHVQVCDVPGIPREFMTDADRVFPGEGDFRLEAVLTALRRIGYSGYVSVELMNPMVWDAKPSQVAELAVASLERSLEQSARRSGV